VVGPIALTRVSRVVACVVRVAGCKAAQADGGEQLCGTHVYDRTRAHGIQKVGTERDGKNLIGPQARIYTVPFKVHGAVGSVDHVIEIPALRVPESFREVSGDPGCRGLVVRGGMPVFEDLGPSCHLGQGVVPQCIDFDGFANPGGDHPVPPPWRPST